MSSRLCATLFLVAVFALASPSTAELFTIELTNGATFETRYRPQVASWDDEVILFLSDVGNWVAVLRADVARVDSQTELKGFGTLIRTHTIALGWAPNDAPTPGEATEADPRDRLLSLLERQLERERRPDYSVRQFVEPTSAGGIPVWMSDTTTPPLGGAAGSGLSAPEPDDGQ